METFELIVSIATAAGIGGIIGAYFQAVFQRQRKIKEQEHEWKLRRYGSISIQMLTKLNPKVGLQHLKDIRPDLKTISDIDEELKTELLNGVIFASDEVITSMADFIRKPSYESYIKTVTSMRKDLWGRKTKIDENSLDHIYE
jgi:hypothetical protein